MFMTFPTFVSLSSFFELKSKLKRVAQRDLITAGVLHRVGFVTHTSGAMTYTCGAGCDPALRPVGPLMC